MDFIANYGLFLSKVLTLTVAFLVIFASIVSIGRRSQSTIQIESLNEAHDTQKKRLMKFIPNRRIKLKKNAQSKAIQKALPTRFVLSFTGDLHASQVAQLRDEISMILTLATPQDEVVVRIESPGGEVSGYGLAASQLMRFRDKQIPLTVCIDKVAASGGYLMACVANQILAAPFAIIGSIGVVAQIPNFHRLLKKNHIDIEQLTAGKYKRTLTLFGENTEEGRAKMKADLEAIHRVFQKYIADYRQQVNLETISTGAHWLAKEAISLGLIDALKTSDDYLDEGLEKYRTLIISTPMKEKFLNKLIKPLHGLLYNRGY